ncbi:MAG: hypothetical protein JO097_04610 [Acidobacteriaceae bacterium]|nr:hypothetical protein [Acidobacteriaceae bacterium]MBV9294195.1 hypothetical protein [Acidobacteriaceae bacterium]MBV9764225.1 hypothetical protein [Acidobacteriaceae bacterium]
MKRRKFTAGTAAMAVLLGLLLASCARLPRSLLADISTENDRLRDAQQQLQRSQNQLQDDITKAPDLFRGAAAPAEWQAKLSDARQKLTSAQSDSAQLAELARANRADSRLQAERLLSQERDLRLAALQETETIEAAAGKWLDVQRHPSDYISELNSKHDEIRKIDLDSVSRTVRQAEQDWPAKKTDLDSRLSALLEIPKSAEGQWSATQTARQDASSGKLTGGEVATLIQEDDDLSRDATTFPHKADELRGECGQLYDAWDKILVDLDESQNDGHRVFREKTKIVRTHFVDVASKKTQTSSDEQWVDVSEPAYHSVENDLGMAIAHKDAGLFDSEAQTTPEPAGFAYIAPPSQGSNQYGYWTHSGGESFWTFLPEYLLLRELMWGHDYRPIVVGEYNGYRTAERMGRSYYGQETPTSLPKYGTHGTFTQTRYAQSRYVQSGGFKGSAYASHRENGSTPAFNSSRFGEHGSSAMNDRAGRRFGSPPGSQGRQFGGLRSPGRRFGGRRR